MKAGQTLVAKDGYQVCLFPLPVLDVIQSAPNSWTHCCGYPMDVRGASQFSILYAPCDCTLYYEDNVGHSCGFVSDRPVHTPKGLRYVSFLFTHGPILGNGKHFKQGEPIYKTGLDNANGVDHAHIDQSFTKNAQLVYGCTCAGGQSWILTNSCSPTDVFYINDTRIIDAKNLNFKTFSGGTGGTTGGGTGEILDWIIPVMDKNPTTTSRQLDEEEMKNNAKCFYGYMNLTYGWTLNACCGMLGNIQSESSINPNRWQGDNRYSMPADKEGFGLVQWTPFTNITDWLKDKNFWEQYPAYGNAECDKIQEELENNEQWIPTGSYPMSFKEFSTSEKDPGYLAMVFLYNYERPASLAQPDRMTQAEFWYDFLKDWEPVLPGESEIERKKKKKFWMYMKPVWKRTL